MKKRFPKNSGNFLKNVDLFIVNFRNPKSDSNDFFRIHIRRYLWNRIMVQNWVDLQSCLSAPQGAVADRTLAESRRAELQQYKERLSRRLGGRGISAPESGMLITHQQCCGSKIQIPWIWIRILNFGPIWIRIQGCFRNKYSFLNYR